MTESELAHLRTEYASGSLNETELEPDPLRQFELWFKQALAARVPEPNAMTLATVGADLRPSARIVLLKDFDPHGFVFFTNYTSRKGHELAQNPYASLLFHWIELERQVRIEGMVEKTDAAQSDAYFALRPFASKIGAWASQQSAIIPNRATLEANLVQFTEQFKNHAPRPPHWGGYRLQPKRIEFWQGRPSRLHDRIQYQHTEQGWEVVRLAP
ncbi:MAG: Pyridoxamine 5'-phosphate oxidase [Glomeribacter sp. 1016415]|nr:Pyridoxamine 5'-phosphate oxidase [Glomeribacter sp. 1016415]